MRSVFSRWFHKESPEVVNAGTNGRLQAISDFFHCPVMAEAFLAASDWLPDGADPYVDGYRENYYRLTGANFHE
jgi:hypothetical protein